MLMIVEVVSAMLFTPFLIRMLGQSQYAVYQLTSQISAYLMLLDLGIGNAVIRYMANSEPIMIKINKKSFWE